MLSAHLHAPLRACPPERLPCDQVRDSALHWAALTGQVKAVRLLVSLGANLDLQTEKGRTALHHAAGATHTRVVYDLIKFGADIHIRDLSNFTAMDLALHVQEHDDLTFIENHEVIRLLEEAGGRRTRLPSPQHSPPPEEHPKFVMPLAERCELIAPPAFIFCLCFVLSSLGGVLPGLDLRFVVGWRELIRDEVARDK
jgi:hypothetical protein